jgi:hypothetical protein
MSDAKDSLELFTELKTLLGDTVTEEELQVLAVTIMIPTVNARIDRKVNLGNYESLGIGISVNRPIFIPEALSPVFERMESEAISSAYKQAAHEITDRVERIKARMRGEDVE